MGWRHPHPPPERTASALFLYCLPDLLSEPSTPPQGRPLLEKLAFLSLSTHFLTPTVFCGFISQMHFDSNFGLRGPFFGVQTQTGMLWFHPL